MGDPGERAELEAFRDFYGLLEQEAGGTRLEIAGAVCGTVEGLTDVLMVNRALGLGFERRATHDDLDEIDAFFREAGTRYQISVSTAAEGLAGLLEERRFEPGYAWAIFRRGIEPYEAGSQLRVEEIGTEDADDFGAVVVEAYGMPPEVIGAVSAAVGRPSWHCFVTYDGEEPAGAAAMFVHEQAAWFGFAGTRPEHRRKGSQGALFAARIDKARELGIDVLATETGALDPDRPSNSYRNITRVGFEERYVRPNYASPE
jgi:GNAT superfamily N-acetyltransferase